MAFVLTGVSVALWLGAIFYPKIDTPLTNMWLLKDANAPLRPRELLLQKINRWGIFAFAIILTVVAVLVWVATIAAALGLRTH